jgi:hypothetical protein
LVEEKGIGLSLVNVELKVWRAAERKMDGGKCDWTFEEEGMGSGDLAWE